MTTAEIEPLAWAWPRPAEKPSIWALMLARLLAHTPGIRKVPWASVMATVPGQSLKETLAPGSGRPDGVTTEPRRMWSGHVQVLELQPGGQRQAEEQRSLFTPSFHSITQQRCLDTPPHLVPLRGLSMALLGTASCVSGDMGLSSQNWGRRVVQRGEENALVEGTGEVTLTGQRGSF